MGGASMKVLAFVIGILFAAAVAALAVALAFPDRFGDYLPDFLQPSVEGGPQLVLGVEPDGVDISQAVAESISVIERRLKDLGVRFKAQPQDNNRILLRLATSANVKRVIEVTTRRGRLQFRLIEENLTPEQVVRGEPPAHAEVLYGRGDRKPYMVYKRSVLTGRDLADAQAAFDQRTSEPVLTFRFNANGARRFGQVTQENVGKPFAIVLDNEVLSAPIIREPILGGTGQISGSFTVEQASDMAILLRAGELPGKLTLIEQR
jgi:protein-export membrane protein SecD